MRKTLWEAKSAAEFFRHRIRDLHAGLAEQKNKALLRTDELRVDAKDVKAKECCFQKKFKLSFAAPANQYGLTASDSSLTLKFFAACMDEQYQLQ